MRKLRHVALVVLPVLAGLVLLMPVDAQATGTWRDAWNAAFPDVCPDLRTAANNCSLCHSSIPSLNPYGADMPDMNFAAINGLDSDGDSVTNGNEILVDCTMPGDSGSVPGDQDSWGAVKALFR